MPLNNNMIYLAIPIILIYISIKMNMLHYILRFRCLGTIEDTPGPPGRTRQTGSWGNENTGQKPPVTPPPPVQNPRRSTGPLTTVQTTSWVTSDLWTTTPVIVCVTNLVMAGKLWQLVVIPHRHPVTLRRLRPATCSDCRCDLSIFTIKQWSRSHSYNFNCLWKYHIHNCNCKIQIMFFCIS